MFENDVDALAKQIMSATRVSYTTAINEAKTRLIVRNVNANPTVSVIPNFHPIAQEWLEVLFRLNPYYISGVGELMWKADFSWGVRICLGTREFKEDSSDMYVSLYFAETGYNLMNKKNWTKWNSADAWLVNSSVRDIEGIMIGPDAYENVHSKLVGTTLDLRKVEPHKKSDAIVKFLNSKFK